MWFEHPSIIHWTGWDSYLTTGKNMICTFQMLHRVRNNSWWFLFSLSEDISDQLMKNRVCREDRRRTQLLAAPGLMKEPISEWRDLLSPSYRWWWIPHHLTLHPLSPKPDSTTIEKRARHAPLPYSPVFQWSNFKMCQRFLFTVLTIKWAKWMGIASLTI